MGEFAMLRSRFLFVLLAAAFACSASVEADPERPPAPPQSEQNAAADSADADSSAFLRDVAERLLSGQRAPGECPNHAGARACLFAARLIGLQRVFDGQQSEFDPQRERVAELVRSAVRRAPSDPQLLWTLAKGVFRDVDPALQAPAIVTLRSLELENLQAWLLGAVDEAWTAPRLQAAAASRRSTSHEFEFMRDDLKTLATSAADIPAARGLGWSPEPIESQQILLIGLYAAEPIPSVLDLLNTCTPGASDWQLAYAHHCWQIAEVMVERSDSLLQSALGVALMKRAAASAAQVQRAAAERRVYLYRQEMAVGLQLHAEGQRAYLRGLRAEGASELSTLRAALVEAGVSASPPAGWRAAVE